MLVGEPHDEDDSLAPVRVAGEDGRVVTPRLQPIRTAQRRECWTGRDRHLGLAAWPTGPVDDGVRVAAVAAARAVRADPDEVRVRQGNYRDVRRILRNECTSGAGRL